MRTSEESTSATGGEKKTSTRAENGKGIPQTLEKRRPRLLTSGRREKRANS